MTVWLVCCKLLWLSTFEALQLYRQKSRVKFACSVVQQALQVAEGRDGMRERDARRFPDPQDDCARAREIIGKAGGKKAAQDKGVAGYFGREGLTPNFECGDELRFD